MCSPGVTNGGRIANRSFATGGAFGVSYRGRRCRNRRERGKGERGVARTKPSAEGKASKPLARADQTANCPVHLIILGVCKHTGKVRANTIASWRLVEVARWKRSNWTGSSFALRAT